MILVSRMPSGNWSSPPGFENGKVSLPGFENGKATLYHKVLRMMLVTGSKYP
jgi:hypothetical protein